MIGTGDQVVSLITTTTGQRIRELREKKKLTQSRLADDADISKGFLSDVENDKRNISSQAILRVARQLGASVDFLLEGKTEEISEVKPVIIPPELSRAADELQLTYSETIELLEVCNAVIARRRTGLQKEITVNDWKELHATIKKVFG